MNLQEAYQSFVQSERRILAEPQRCCCVRHRKLVLSLVALLSLLTSVVFFFVTGYLIWATEEKNMILILIALFCFTEAMAFGKYFVDILLLKREKARWHLLRLWIPLVDVVAILIALFLESLLLPCGTLYNFWNEASQLEPVDFWLSIQSMVTLGVKLVTGLWLTIIHLRKVNRLIAAKFRYLDPDNFPYSQDLDLKPSAPLNDDL